VHGIKFHYGYSDFFTNFYIIQVTGTHIAYLHLCHRKLWLFGNGINMEHTSDVVAEGKLIGETSYTDRSEKFTEVEVDGIKIDFYDARNKVIHEVKKSNKVSQAHIAQVKYYIYKLTQKGVEGVTGVLEYPRLKIREDVYLTAEDLTLIPQWEADVKMIIEQELCPPLLHSTICKSCSYFDFCYSNETNEI
jgi:CRISPR-associated exonuclease Cas4